MGPTLYASWKQINSPDCTGPTIASVTEYAGVNLNHELGPHGHWTMATLPSPTCQPSANARL